MSSARHHSEWLSLVEVSGPFLSVPVLSTVFPQGLEEVAVSVRQSLRIAYEEWQEDSEKPGSHHPLHRAWFEYVLKEFLGFPAGCLVEDQGMPPGMEARLPEHGITLRPDYALLPPPGEKNRHPRLLANFYPVGQDLDKPLAGEHWKASPATRMMELLHAANVPLGLLSNGEQWMLVYAPIGETTGFASWYSYLWFEEQVTLRAFFSLLCARRFFGVAEDDTPVRLLERSAQDQQEVTDQLGYQVRKAVEVLIQALDRADQDRHRSLLAGLIEKHLYEAALTFMMRLVFLFSAEERGLLLKGNALYDQNYAVSTLREQLREVADQHGEEILERRHDAWSRLLATFRAIHGGVHHEDMRIPAYGGRLFDPDRFPFLEGRPTGSDWRSIKAVPVSVNNRTVLHLLEALQTLEIKIPGDATPARRRISFRALDVEQIGHVYEGLLDHTAKRAPKHEAVLGLSGTKDKEPEFPLSELEARRAKGDDALCDFLHEETKRSLSALQNGLARTPDHEAMNQLRVACGNDEGLVQRVAPYWGLLRDDSFGRPVVIPPGGVYVTSGEERRSSGTHYTPRALTEPIVKYTLEPLVYHGPAEGLPKEQWTLKPAKDLLDLRICDMAMGSGAFLVQTCRYMSDVLLEAWERAQQAYPGVPAITPEGLPSKGDPREELVPKDPDERRLYAMRLVCERCLYGVDRNPIAVEMAKLSLWLITMQKDRPFTFLNHALRTGDSLLGLTDIEQLTNFHLRPREGYQVPLVAEILKKAIRKTAAKRRELESFVVSNIVDALRKEALLQEAEEAMEDLRLVGDLIVGAALATAGKKGDAYQEKLNSFELLVNDAMNMSVLRGVRLGQIEELSREARKLLREGVPDDKEPRRPFHWVAEFPELFYLGEAGTGSEKKGFDAIVGNPPFLGGQRMTGILGTDYRDFIVEYLADGKRGSADLCAYFFLRGSDVLNPGGSFGLLSTNTIAQGDTREVGLAQLVKNGGTVYRAVQSRKWPGQANLEVAEVWLRKGDWKGQWVLEEQIVTGITPFLSVPGKVVGTPYRLAANAGQSFQGSIVLGMGFVLDREEAQALIAKNPRNKDVLSPYLNGEDLNSRPDQSPSRWVINFFDWTAEQAMEYPDCWQIIEEKVRPERQRKTANGEYALRKPLPQRYWIYGEKRPGLYSTIAGMERVLALCLVTHHVGFGFCPSTIVFAHRLVVFPLDKAGHFSMLQSNFHEPWARYYSSQLETRLNYSPTDCFETFPFPRNFGGTETVGDSYYTHRQFIMVSRQEGLTKTYNRFHLPRETAEDIARLRELHVEMDHAVAKAYGWEDLDLGHGFHETKQGLRYTICEPARKEVLDRLLALNHERYAEEVAQGLHDKGKKKVATKSKKKTTETGQDKFQMEELNFGGDGQ